MAKYMLNLPDDLHKQLKIMAVTEETTIRDIVLEALKQYLDKKARS